MRKTFWFAALALLMAGQAHAAVITVTPPEVSNTPALNQWYITNLRTTPGFTSTTVGGITGNNPRSGNGSVELSLTDGSGKVDFQYYWGYDATRTLGTLSALAYDWYRDSSSTNPNAQQPAFRLIYDADGDASTTDDTGYLIWEAVYQDGFTAPATTDAWVSSDMLPGDFWMRAFSPGTTIEEYGISLAEWISTGAVSSAADDLSASTKILGIDFGIGSGWNGEFLGYVDNVSFAFGGEATTFNFELASVPEPATLALLGLGLLGVGLRRRRAAG